MVGLRLEHHATGCDLADAIRSRSKEPRNPVGPGATLDHREARVGHDSQERRIGLTQGDLDGSGIGGTDLPHDTRNPPQERSPYRTHRCHTAVSDELTGEAIRHLRGSEQSSIVKADAGAEGKRPGEPVS